MVVHVFDLFVSLFIHVYVCISFIKLYMNTFSHYPYMCIQ